ncbi:uncharacterized protein LOC127814214 isoform X2 [Diospyros lotus]|uniref:uncharacterized protein LOC127814214 isoform X2 n=1 Tax=Diospyros lotus TaxID=55363 RepID=UPI002256EAD0|nr:uncharacterized protein LOC127814214 isoform X2 [Diospyros lotus]
MQFISGNENLRYLLAEAGDTLFASFIGTKQYKDVMADANILQGAIFHEDAIEDNCGISTTESTQVDSRKINVENPSRSLEEKPRQSKPIPKPAVHRGFMARAKGIPALELYRLAQKKKRKLVLCGHSLGGAVAALATLAILRVIAASSSLKDNEKVQVKCITFSQPPVGNAALRDYVNGKGWHHYFKTYCIPEDLVPRILSPAYFHHYNAQTAQIILDAMTSSSSMSKHEEGVKKQKLEKVKENEGEQLVLGLGPVQTSFWRLFRLVPLEGVRRQFNKYKGKKVDPIEASSTADSSLTSPFDVVAAPQCLEIQESSEGVSLKPLPETGKGPQGEARDSKSPGKLSKDSKGNDKAWRRVPYLPSYVPFGQLYLLGNSSVESLSGAEYSKLTSVRSVIAEVRELFQSHSMKSYRSRFQRIYDLCMTDDALPFLGVDQLQQFPHLQKWLGPSFAGTVELGHIVESPVIRAATSVVPLGWKGVPGAKNGEPLKVDITGFGLHLCTLVQARVNGNWCSTTVESFPSSPTSSLDGGVESCIQKIRVLVGPPLRRPPRHQNTADPLLPVFPSIDSNSDDLEVEQNIRAFQKEKCTCPEGLSDFSVFCTSDFSTVSKEVHIRTRRVRLVGLEGAGKTSLLKAILGQDRLIASANIEHLHMDAEVQEGISGGLCYSDSSGINLQDLHKEALHFKDELWRGIRDLTNKTDLIILVHNLSHRIPRYSDPNASRKQPALSLLLDEAKALGIPWVLAITNKFSVSAHQQKAAIDTVLQAYQASPSTTEVINSCPYVMPSAAGTSLSGDARDANSDGWGPQRLVLYPINIVRRPFQKKAVILPVEGVTALRQLVHHVLRSHEEAAMQELARERLLVEFARERALVEARDSQTKANSSTAAALGASLGAGLGIVLAVVMGAASALRKPS